MAPAIKLTWLAVILSWSAKAACQEAPLDVRLGRGDQAFEKGDFPLALKEYEGVLKDTGAVTAFPKRLRLETTLKSALAIQGWSKHQPGTAPPKEKAIEQYKTVLNSDLDLKDRMVAANNLARLLSTDGRNNDAATVLQSFMRENSNFSESPDAPILHLTLGEILDKAQKPIEAYAELLSALRARPELDPPVNAAFRLVTSGSSRDIGRCVELLDVLLEAHRPATAGRFLAEALKSWHESSEVARLAPAVLRYCAEALVTEEQLRDASALPLREARAIPELSNLIGLMVETYKPSFFEAVDSPLFAQEPEDSYGLLHAVLRYFPAPKGIRPIAEDPLEADAFRRSLSLFLKVVGDTFYSRAVGPQSEAPTERVDSAAREAALRYSAAWTLDRRHVAAGLRLFATLNLNNSWSSKQGARATEDLISAIFSAKNNIYAGLSQSNRKQDFINLYHFHWLLGGIFDDAERKKDPQRRRPPGDSHSPVFQYERAIWAEAQIRERFKDMTFPKSPALRNALKKASEEAAR